MNQENEPVIKTTIDDGSRKLHIFPEDSFEHYLCGRENPMFGVVEDGEASLSDYVSYEAVQNDNADERFCKNCLSALLERNKTTISGEATLVSDEYVEEVLTQAAKGVKI